MVGCFPRNSEVKGSSPAIAEDNRRERNGKKVSQSLLQNKQKIPVVNKDINIFIALGQVTFSATKK